MALKAFNNSVEPNGLIPTLLIFRAYPHIAKSDALLPTIAQQAVALHKAIKEIKKLKAAY